MAFDLTSFREGVQESIAENWLAQFTAYLGVLASEGTIEDRRKSLEYQGRILGLEMTRKDDPNAALAVVNITIENGVTHVDSVLEAPAADVQDVVAKPANRRGRPRTKGVLPEPEQAAIMPPEPPLDLTETMLFDLDAMLEQSP